VKWAQTLWRRISFPTGDYVMLGGLINHRLGRIAEEGDTVELEGGHLEVLEMDLHRITKVRFKFQVSEEGEEPALQAKEETTPDTAPEPEAGPMAGEDIQPPRARLSSIEPDSGITPFNKKTGS
jgi:hypothetical protein